jgi:hypothetical protein
MMGFASFRKMSKGIIYTLYFCLQSLWSHAAPGADTGRQKLPDSLYIMQYDHQLHLRTKYGTQYMEYKSFFPGGLRLVTRPNETYSITFGFSYRFIDLSYSFSPPFISLNKDNEIKGETFRKAFSGSFSFHRVTVYGEYINTKGFYLANTDEFDSTWERGDPYIQFPDSRIKQLGASISYCTNPRFSLPSVRGGDERQLKTAGTLLPVLSFQNFVFSSENSNPDEGKTEATHNFDMTLAVPYAINFVIKKQGYISAGAGPAIGVDFFKSLAFDANSNLVTTKGTRFAYGFLARMNVGYNGPRFFGGFEGLINQYSHNSSNEQRLQKVSFLLQLFVGVRIKPPKFLKQSVEWCERKWPILE